MRISRWFFVVFFVFAFGACGQGESAGAANTGTGSNTGGATPAAGALGAECQKVEKELTAVCGDVSKMTKGEQTACDIEQKALKATQVLVKVSPEKAEAACKKQSDGWTEKGGLAAKVKASGELMDKAGISK